MPHLSTKAPTTQALMVLTPPGNNFLPVISSPQKRKQHLTVPATNLHHSEPPSNSDIIKNFITRATTNQNFSKKNFVKLFTYLARRSKVELNKINLENKIQRSNMTNRLFLKPKRDDALKEVFELLKKHGSDLKYNTAEMTNAADEAFGLEDSFPSYFSPENVEHAATKTTVASFNKIFKPENFGEFKKAQVTIRENGRIKESYEASVLGIEKEKGKLAKVQLLKGINVFPSIVIDPQYRQWREENKDLNAKINIKTGAEQFRFSVKTGNETTTVDFKLID